MANAKQSASAASRKQAFADFVVELMSGLGPVVAKRMFGGHGIYLHELMFALIVEERLYLKADEQTVAQFQSRGLPPFSYETRNGTQSSLSYFEAPGEVYDEREHMLHWARLGYDSAVRKQAQTAAKKSRAKAGVAKVAGKTVAKAGSGKGESVAGKSQAAGQAHALSQLANLGPKSVEMLAKAGIKTSAQLHKMGSVQAFARVKARNAKASLNLLWALEGALTGRDWRVVAEHDRASLLMALEDVMQHAGD